MLLLWIYMILKPGFTYCGKLPSLQLIAYGQVLCISGVVGKLKNSSLIFV